MVHAVTNVCMKYIYKVIYVLSVDLVTFDLGLPAFKGQIKVTDLSMGCTCLINGTSYDQSLYEIHIVSNIWPFSLPFNI